MSPEPVTPGSLVVEADGGSRGNPGVAGYGALVRDARGRVLVERAAPLGRASNNVAEYTGLIVGLEAAAEVDPAADVLARMDSKLVVEQMSGRWKIKHEDMRRLADEARVLVAARRAAGGSVRFEWIPRALNGAADALSNEGMDGHTVDRRPTRAEHGMDDDVDDVSRDPDDRGAPPEVAAPTEDRAPTVDPELTANLGPSGAHDATAAGPGGTRTADPARAVPSIRPARPSGPPTRGPGTRVVLVRHGVTDLTVTGRLDGRGGVDPSLNAQGQRQALAAGRSLRRIIGGPDDRAGGPFGEVRVVSSSLARAVQTGRLVGAELECPAVADPAWDEQDVGEWDGASLADLVAAHGDAFSAMRSDVDVRPPGGETFAELAARVRAAFADVVAAGGTTIVATHRGPLMAVLEHALGLAHEMAWRFTLAPGSITVLRAWPDGGLAVDVVNDTSHLGG